MFRAYEYIKTLIKVKKYRRWVACDMKMKVKHIII